MATITTATGKVIDIDTGEVVGQQEALVPQEKLELPVSAMDVARQGSYALNAAMFSIPDAGVKAIGRALGMDDKEVVTLTKFFNRGDTGPKNVEERYARAIGEAIGANLPLTGVLGYVAKTKALTAPMLADAGVVKRLAKDTLDFIRKNPKTAVAVDVMGSAAFGAARQGVEENMEPGLAKDVAREVLPLGASVLGPAGVIAAGSVASKLPLPSMVVGRYAKELIAPSEAKLTQVGKEIVQEYPWFMRPVVKPLVGRAETQAAKGLSRGEVQEMLAKTEKLMADLRANSVSPELLQQLRDVNIPEGLVAKLQTEGVTPSALTQLTAAKAPEPILKALREEGILLNTAERTLLPNFMRQQGNLIKSMSSEQLREEIKRRTKNMMEFDGIINRLAPKSAVELEDALSSVKLDSDNLQQAILDSMASRQGVERERLAQMFTPLDQNRLGSEIRETILKNGESTFFNLRNVAEKMGLRNNFTLEDGVPLPTRDNNGVSQFEAVNIEKPVNQIISKYNVLTGPIREYAPGLARVLGNYARSQKGKGATAYQEALTKELSDIFTARNRPGAGGATPDFLAADEVAKGTAQADRAFLQQQEFNARSLVSALLEPSAGTGSRPGLADLKLPAGKQQELLAKSFGLEPEDLTAAMARAKESASKVGQVDINFPEAIRLLQVSTESRNNAIRNLNDAQMAGRSREVAQVQFDKINALHKDIESMLTSAIPKMGSQYKNFKSAYNDVYGAAYERYLPLLLGSKRPTGEFVTSNEAVLKRVFETGENVDDVSFLLGSSDEGKALMTSAASDWLRTKPIFDKDGFVDPKKLQKVLDNNKNIVDKLPPAVKAGFYDELDSGRAFATRMAQLERRRELVADEELTRLLAKSTREGADPADLINRALRDPADMTKLVNALGRKEPQRLEALRRAVFKEATEGQPTEISITSFLNNANPRSLKVLFSEEQLTNLRQLGELEKHIKASPGIVDTPSPFETTNDGLRRILGTSIEGMTGLYKSIAENRVGPAWATVYLGTRLVGRQEYGLLDRVMQKAVTDPAFAQALVKSVDERKLFNEMKGLNKKLMSSGVYLPEVLFKGPMREANVLAVEGMQEPTPTSQEPTGMAPAPQVAPPAPPVAPPAPQGNAAQMMEQFKKSQPPAPPTRGNIIPAPPARNKLPPQPQTSNAAQMYQALFPNDTLGNLIQQKQQMPQ